MVHRPERVRIVLQYTGSRSALPARVWRASSTWHNCASCPRSNSVVLLTTGANCGGVWWQLEIVEWTKIRCRGGIRTHGGEIDTVQRGI